ncbi:hypothetical protein IVA87_33915 [Bradyrhizobium sp. 147]|uniref:hypothetical protein n=1 Tax=Bradyrhizobium sp. 147 TaxID=2782623 RepID=UPI001FFB94FB|nr:hypothetical protein [Bradyrhizobium sp. 147]MCK1684251.1 hypothetical protein [Bradyrhizobium sp. 147]
MIDIEDVKRIKLGAGDLLAVQVDGIFSTETLGRVKAMFEAYPELRGRVIVLDHSVKLSVVSAEIATGAAG